MHPSPPTLSLRQLNRATLARQLLLARARVEVVDAVERLAGLQAQLARPPFVGLWARVAGFRREDLLTAVHARRVVRATMMRGTLHLASARDYARLRPALHPALAAGAAAILGERAAGVDRDALLRAARELYAERPRTFDELRPLLAARGLSADERALGYLVRMELPLVQVPAPDAPWGWDAKAPFTLAASWLGVPPGGEASPHALVRAYLAAFGPATPADAGAWSGLRGLRETFEALRPELATFRDERGRELFDLPDAPRPDPDVEAPARFLPEFDSLVLAHDDRARVIAAEHRPRVVSKNLQVAATFLVDGMVAGTWKAERKRGVAILAAQPFGRLRAADRRALEAEGVALLRFVEPEAKGYEVTFAPPG